jgi:type I restriction enzyme, S subunit
MTDLPPGWAQTTLGEIAHTSLGKMLDRGKGTGEYAVPYLRNVNVQWGRIDLDDVLTMDIAPEDRDYFRLDQGDLLLCEGGEIGRCAIWPGQAEYMAYQKALHRIRPQRCLEVKYLRYLMEHMSLTGLLLSYSTGSTIRHLPQQQLRRILLPLPPTAEQRRIVAALEDHLSRLDSSSASIRSALQRASRLRFRLLADSVTGSGTNRNQYRLGQVIKSVRNGMYISRPGAEPDGVPILRIGSVRPLRLDVTDVRYSGRSDDAINRDGYLLQPGDLLFTRYNGNAEYVGACAIVPDGVGSLTYPDKLIRVRVNRSYALPEYLALVCSAGETRAAIRRSVKTTAGQAGISGRELKSIPVRLPRIEEQKLMVQWFTEHDESVRRLESALALASRKASALRISLLREAFEGRLVEQDPVDEPASLLLERIRAAPVAPESARRSRRGSGELTPQKEALF